jgi:hypothetical protein
MSCTGLIKATEPDTNRQSARKSARRATATMPGASNIQIKDIALANEAQNVQDKHYCECACSGKKNENAISDAHGMAPMLGLCALLLSLMPVPTTCTACAAGWYSLSVADGLVGLTSSIALSTLEEWTAQGVSGWKMGNAGETCETACGNSKLQCHSLVISGGDAIAILASLGRTYVQMQILMADSIGGVFCDANGAEWGKMSETCTVNMVFPPGCSEFYGAYDRVRLCPCGTSGTVCIACAAGTYSSEGQSTCTDCAAGKYSDTAGVSACQLCGAGKYLPGLVAPGLNALIGKIAMSTLKKWTAAGVVEWKMITDLESAFTCSTGCIKAELSCDNSIFPQYLSEADTRAIFESLGYNCYVFDSSQRDIISAHSTNLLSHYWHFEVRELNGSLCWFAGFFQALRLLFGNGHVFRGVGNHFMP